MPSLPQQTIPAAGNITIQIVTTRKLAVLKITNEGANPMTYRSNLGMYGDVIPPNNGSCAYHRALGDKPTKTFYVEGTAADTFSVYYEVM